MIEIERTFLAREIPKEVVGARPERVLDIYLPEADEYPKIRLRHRGEGYELIKKVPNSTTDFSEQTEYVLPLDAHEFELLASLSKRSVSKLRYRVVIDRHEAEVDVFDGALTGLVLIDFEFMSGAERDEFDIPTCCLADVTQDLFITGARLAGKSYADVEQDLARFGYKPLILQS